MRFKTLLTSAVAGFTAFAMTVTMLPIGGTTNVQAAEMDSMDSQPKAAAPRNAAGTPETTDYLFAYFPYTGDKKDERIYFGISEDGLNFTALNNEQFILESTMGTHGLRDPFIIRSHEGDKFFLIATDLTVAGLEQDGTKYPGQGWSTNQVSGSQSIMIWESTDLVNWSEQRMRKVAVDTAGCTWAPEAYWDDELGEYVVFWASRVSDDNHEKQRLYYATTPDFDTFSDAKVWIDAEGDVIDSTVIKAGEYYYRYTKNEQDKFTTSFGTKSKHVYCERSKSLTSTNWELVYKDSLTEDINISIEGPCIYKFNEDDKANAAFLASLKGIDLDDTKDIYGLIADNNGNYIFPGISDDITTGQFHRLGEAQSATIDGIPIYSMPKPTASHGTIMPITSEEYNNLRIAYDEGYRTAAEPYVTQVENDTAALSLPSNISANLTLPVTGTNGSVITWESSNPSIIAPNGNINRPTYKQGDATVTLTATITAKQQDDSADVRVRDQIRTKSFQVTVEKLAQKKFTVTFDSKGGSKIVSQTVLDGNKAAAPKKNPTKKGYLFGGWYNGNAKYNFNSAVTRNLTLTAKWTKVTVKTPSKPTLKYKKSKLTITIKKVSGAAGYQVVYSTDKKFKKGVTKKDITGKTLTIKKPKKNKTYYVKLKAYKKDSTGKKVYSSKFSKVSKLKIKK